MQKEKLFNREEYENWKRNWSKDYCAFCDWKKMQIPLKEGKHWVWIVNRAPYWKYHSMFITKRHARRMSELSEEELKEYFELNEYAISKFRETDLKREDGSDIKKFMFFWRLRLDQYDPVTSSMKPDHLHVHLTPDKDGLWDPIMDDEAWKYDVRDILSFD